MIMQTEFDFEAATAKLLPLEPTPYISHREEPKLVFTPDPPELPHAPKVMGTFTYKTETDPNGKDPHAPGAKLDQGKLRPWLCISGFARALEEVSRVTTKGAEKYTPNGWAEVENGEERYLEAFGRHLLALGRGETFDDGPKGLGPDVYHKASMIWNLLASLELELRNKK